MNRHIHEIRKRLAEQRRLSHHNHTHHQLIGEATTMERFWIKARRARAISKAAMI
jgi:hypothetical protein